MERIKQYLIYLFIISSNFIYASGLADSLKNITGLRTEEEKYNSLVPEFVSSTIDLLANNIAIITFSFVLTFTIMFLFNSYKSQMKNEQSNFNVLTIASLFILLILTAPIKDNKTMLMYFLYTNMIESSEFVDELSENQIEKTLYNLKVNDVKSNEFEELAFDMINNLSFSLSEKVFNSEVNLLVKDQKDNIKVSVNADNYNISVNYDKNFAIRDLAENVGISLNAIEQKENDFVVSVYSKLFKNALNTSNYISTNFVKGYNKIEFFRKAEEQNLIKYFNDNKNMCSSLYDKSVFDLRSKSEATLFKYQKFAAFCISNNITEDLKADREYLLSGNSVKYKASKIISEAKKICNSKQPFLLCEQALNYADKVKIIKDAKMGVFTKIGEQMINQTTPFSINNTHYNSLFTYSMTETNNGRIGNGEEFGKTIAEINVVIKADKNDILYDLNNKLEVSKNELLLKASNLQVSDIVNEFTTNFVNGTKKPFKRLTVCANYPDHFKDGYICQSPSKEFSNFTRSMGNNSIYLQANRMLPTDKKLSKNVVGTVGKDLNKYGFETLGRVLKMTMFFNGVSGNSPDFLGAGDNTMTTGLAFTTLLSIIDNTKPGQLFISQIIDNLNYFTILGMMILVAPIMSLYLFLVIKIMEVIIEVIFAPFKIKKILMRGEDGIITAKNEIISLLLKSVMISIFVFLSIETFEMMKELLIVNVVQSYLPDFNISNVGELVLLLKQLFVFYIILFITLTYSSYAIPNLLFTVFSKMTNTQDLNIAEKENGLSKSAFNRLKIFRN